LFGRFIDQAKLLMRGRVIGIHTQLLLHVFFRLRIVLLTAP
jgi:hypothetical protein